jgi:hypothetical protein
VLDIFQIGSQELFAWLASTTILLLSASCIARIIDMSHQHQLIALFLQACLAFWEA